MRSYTRHFILLGTVETNSVGTEIKPSTTRYTVIKPLTSGIDEQICSSVVSGTLDEVLKAHVIIKEEAVFKRKKPLTP